MKRFIPLFLIVCLLLAGCGGEAAGEVTEPSQATVPVTDSPTEAPDVTVTQPTNSVAWDAGIPSPLTGEPLTATLTNRPFAVTFNNIVDAMPQWGVSHADILYELLAEGGITRCLGILHDPANAGNLGSIRSTRPYLVDLAMAYDAVYVHAGGSDDGYSELSATGCDHIDGVKGSNSGKYFYRDQTRLSSGYALEHTLFITGEDAVAYAAERDITLSREVPMDYGLTFAQNATPAEGTKADKVTIDFASSSKTTTMTYDPATGLYSAFQYGEDYIDAATGNPLTFRNLFLLTADTHYDSKGYRVYITLTGTGEGWFACGGEMIPILWSREDVDSPFVYTKTDGTPLTLGVGKTYIAIGPHDSEMICE